MCIPKWVVDRRLGSVTYTRIENLFLGGMKDKEVNKDRTISNGKELLERNRIGNYRD